MIERLDTERFVWSVYMLVPDVFGGLSSQRRSRFERATRSLATFIRSHRSLRSLALQRSVSLRWFRSLALFTGSLTHFALSLVGRLKFLNMCSHCYRVSKKETRFWRSLETRPKWVYAVRHAGCGPWRRRLPRCLPLVWAITLGPEFGANNVQTTNALVCILWLDKDFYSSRIFGHMWAYVIHVGVSVSEPNWVRALSRLVLQGTC